MNKKSTKIVFLIFLIVIIFISIGIFSSKTKIEQNTKIAKIEASESKNYTVIFDGMGGTGVPESITVDDLNIIMPSTVPTKTGYVFNKWKIKGTDVTGYPNKTFYNIKDYADSNGQICFEAVWGYKIVFDANGGTNGPDDMLWTEGDITIPTTVPTKTGRIFNKWKIKGTDVTGYPNNVFHKIESYADERGVVTFVAEWGYKIVFDANGGTNGPDDMLWTEGDITIPTTVPTKTGRIFNKWKIKGTDVTGYPNNVFHKIESYADERGVVTFVAEWGYKIVFDANGGTGAPSEQFKNEGEKINLSSERPTRAGYKFLGWSKDKNATTATYLPGTEFSEEGNVTLYAIWEEIIYTITYDTNRGENKPENQTKKEGTTIKLSNQIPTKKGYKFLGWSKDKNATTATYLPGIEFSEEGNVTLYAIWEEIIYTITYDTNRGENKPENQTKKEGTTIKLSNQIPTKKGYKFLGWSKDKNATTATYLPGIEFSEEGNVTLYAVWEKEMNNTGDANNIVNDNTNNIIKNDITNDNTSNTVKNDIVNNTIDDDINNTIKNDIINDNTSNTVKNDIVNNTTDDNINNTIKNDVTNDDTTKDEDSDDNETKNDNTKENNKVNENKVERNAINPNNTDNTKSGKILPNAGMNTLRNVIILVVIISLIFGFKYKSTKLS